MPEIRRKLFEKLKETKTNNTKQAAWIAIGSLFSFGFGIISSMILSRCFDKADYGTYKQVMYVYDTLLTVFTLGLPRAYSYFLPRVPISQSRSLINKISKVFIVLGLVFSITLFSFAGIIADILKNDDLEGAVRLFAIVPSLLLPTMGLEGILATFKKSEFMAIYTVSTRIVMLVFVVTPVLIFHGGYKEAIIGFVIASFVSLLFAHFLKYLPVKNEEREQCSISIKEIFQFSLPLLFASIWGMIIGSSDQFFVSRYFGKETFAEFSNGNIDMPFIGMIIGATATVLSPVFSRMSYEQVNPKTEIFPLWKTVFEKSAILIYPLVVYCIVFANTLMALLYGNKYEVSGGFFQIKLITNFFTIIAFAPLLINIGKVKFYSSVHMYGALSLVVLEFIGVRAFSSPYAISAISAICSIGRIIVMLLAIAKIFGISFWELFPFKLMVKLIVPPALFLFAIKYVLVDICGLSAIYIVSISIMVYGVIFLFYSRIVNLDYLSIIKSISK